MKKILNLSVILLVGVCLLSSCAKQSSLVGKWVCNYWGKSLSVEFFKDGKLETLGFIDSQPPTLWRDLGNGKLQLGATDDRGKERWGDPHSYEIRDRELRIDYYFHKEIVFTKQ